MANLTLNTDQAEIFIRKSLNASLTPILTSSPGVGKSSIIRKVCDALNLLLIDVRLAQCEPSDLLGIPNFIDVPNIINGDVVGHTKKCEFIPNVMFPLVGDTLPINLETGKQYDGWLVFFDELLDAPMQVQSASYKVILDRMVGNFHLHEKVYMVGAGNKITDGACATDTSTALKSRLVWAELESDYKTWIRWAKTAGIHPSLIGFVEYKKDDALFNFDVDHDGFTFACPRTVEMASKVMYQYTDEEMMKTQQYVFEAHMFGTIGALTTDLMAFLQCFDKLPTRDEVIRNPNEAKLVKDGERFALNTIIGDWATDEKSLEAITQYLKRIDRDGQVLLFRTVRDNLPNITNSALTEMAFRLMRELKLPIDQIQQESKV